jgi:hypothetical protein
MEGAPHSHLGQVQVYDAMEQLLIDEAYPNKSKARARLFEITREELEELME